MARYLTRGCPHCKEELKLIIPQPLRKEREKSVSGICLKCGYEFRWKVVLGKGKPRRKIPPF